MYRHDNRCPGRVGAQCKPSMASLGRDLGEILTEFPVAGVYMPLADLSVSAIRSISAGGC